MLNRYQIIDADCHAYEPPDLWENYLEPQFKPFAPSLSGLEIGRQQIYKNISTEIRQYITKKIEEHHPISVMSNGFDSESYIIAMDQMGIDRAFLYPSYGIWLLAVDEMSPQLAGAFTRAYNNWLNDFCSYNPDRLKAVGAINRHAPDEMVPELHRIANLGWKAVFLHPNPIKGRLLSNPDYEPFWTACEKLDIAVGIHEGTHCRVPTVGSERFNTRFALHACSHPMEQMMALLALIEGGVLERYPKLKIGFLESGCGWLPYWLWRLDEEYKNLYWEVSENVKMKPSDYFRRQCYIAIEPTEPYLPEIIDYIGSDNLIFGSDYPHMDHQSDIVEKMVGLEDRLSKETVQKIVWDNPCRFYGIV